MVPYFQFKNLFFYLISDLFKTTPWNLAPPPRKNSPLQVSSGRFCNPVRFVKYLPLTITINTTTGKIEYSFLKEKPRHIKKLRIGTPANSVGISRKKVSSPLGKFPLIMESFPLCKLSTAKNVSSLPHPKNVCTFPKIFYTKLYTLRKQWASFCY